MALGITEFIGLALTGLFTGIGVALGSYLANRHIIEHTETMIKRLTKTIKTRFK